MDAFLKMNKVTALLTGAWLLPALFMILISTIELGYVPHAETHVNSSAVYIILLFIVEISLLVSLLLLFLWFIVTVYLILKNRTAVLSNWFYNLFALVGALGY